MSILIESFHQVHVVIQKPINLRFLRHVQSTLVMIRIIYQGL